MLKTKKKSIPYLNFYIGLEYFEELSAYNVFRLQFFRDNNADIYFLYIILKDIVLLENTEKKDSWALIARYTHCVAIHINSCIVRLINFMKHHSDVYFCFI